LGSVERAFESAIDSAYVLITRVWEFAGEYGGAAPINRRIAELVHEIERAGAGSPKMTPERLLRALSEG
jgi:hypothetical protein